MGIGCVILAAGKSVRFGANKLLAPLAGKQLLEHILDAIPTPCFSQVVAVVSDPEVEALCRRHGVKTVAYEGGPQSQSIRLGLEAVQNAEGCLFVLGDQPLCSTGSIHHLVSAFQAQPRVVHRLAYQGQPSSPTLFPAHLFPALMELAGEHGGMAAVGDTPVLYTEAAGPQELWDADTPEKLARIQQYLLAHP